MLVSSLLSLCHGKKDLRKSGKKGAQALELLLRTASVRLIDKEQHTSEEKKKAEEDEIRKVESERPLEGENQVLDFWKKKG